MITSTYLLSSISQSSTGGQPAGVKRAAPQGRGSLACREKDTEPKVAVHGCGFLASPSMHLARRSEKRLKALCVQQVQKTARKLELTATCLLSLEGHARQLPVAKIQNSSALSIYSSCPLLKDTLPYFAAVDQKLHCLVYQFSASVDLCQKALLPKARLRFSMWYILSPRL